QLQYRRLHVVLANLICSAPASARRKERRALQALLWPRAVRAASFPEEKRCSGRSAWSGRLPLLSNHRRPRTASALSRPHAAGAQRRGFQIVIKLHHLLGLLRITEQPASLAAELGVLYEGGRLDEIIVAELFGDAVDRAGALVDVCEPGAVARNAFLHVFDARMRRIIMHRRIARGCCGKRARQKRCREGAGRASLA